MKKIIFIISFLLAISYPNLAYAEDSNEIIKPQEENLGISKFIEEAKDYTKETFEDFDLENIYESALSGNISLKGIPRCHFKTCWNRSYENSKNTWIYLNYYNST